LSLKLNIFVILLIV